MAQTTSAATIAIAAISITTSAALTLPGRIASLYDVLANAIGILLGSFIASGANTKLRG